MRTITLELLRHGPPHNQLLSPLTSYLALCENHPAVSWQVPVEHNQMLHRLRALAYEMGDEPREFQITDTARLLGDLLGAIPGLTADLNRQGAAGAAKDDGCEDVTHLQLILSASELALLPFELATAPAGFPGAGQPLSLQAQQPVCITRGTRRLPDEVRLWPRRPCVLFAYASPPGYQPVPAQAHLLALRRALEPWLVLPEDASAEERRAAVAKRLHVLPEASVPTLEKACASGRYTHVHILAHGAEIRDEYDLRHGLALHSDGAASGAEVVSGERLASVLRAPKAGEPGCFTRPSVVTLASCNAGNQGTVMGVGASIGHALHEAGVPLVVASQFPLSFGGSVLMVQELYVGLLWGEDPRKLLVGLRRRLHARYRDRHDWASLTAYASLPADFERQLADAAVRRSMDSIDVALGVADQVLLGFTDRERSRFATRKQGTKEQVEQALRRVRDARGHLESAMRTYPEKRSIILPLLASTDKREAQLRFQLHGDARTGGFSAETAEGAPVVEGLERARQLYWDAYLAARADPWTLVQYLSLTLVLQEMGRLPKPLNRADQDMLSLWRTAEVQSLYDAENGSESARAWAWANLAELYLLAPLVLGLQGQTPGVDFGARALDAAHRIVALTRPSSFHVFSTRRQMLRYVDWLNYLAPSLGGINSAAEALIDALPAAAQPDWDY
jgi:hypothetical protein